MSLATDPRYRSIRLAWLNNDAAGNEIVQVFAKPSGGSWSLVRSIVVGASSQLGSWDTALPVTAYELAMRYIVVNVPAVGYESSDPDAWTAATAPDSKTTFNSTAETPVLSATEFAGAATPITLSWATAQLECPYLVEKNIGAGWVTVVADLEATSYPYTVPGGELNTTVQFRVTPKRGSVAGTASNTVSVLMTVVVGQPTITTSTFDASTGRVSLAWTAATNALTYLVEKRIGVGAWSTVTTISGLSTTYDITAAEANQTLQFRVTGQNGAVSGTPSATANVATTMTVGVTTIGTMSKSQGGVGTGAIPWSIAVSGNVVASGTLTGQQVEWSQDGVVFETDTIGAAATLASKLLNGGTTPPGFVTWPGSYGYVFSVRVRGVAAGPTYGPWSASASIVV